MLVCHDSEPVAASPAPAGGDGEQWVTTMDGRRLRVTEGAFLETNGALLGFDLLECRDMAEAIQVAADHPLARRCVLELRPSSAD
jgi:hypothetical protein